MNAKETKLYEFYKQCAENGYHNMQDATACLKAKVIAMDLELKYKDISQLYIQAKEIYEKETLRQDKERELQNTSGKLLLKLAGRKTDIFVYQREDGSIFHRFSSLPTAQKIEGAPTINVHSGGSLLYTYHPSKTVFTGASSGGLAMGGFHNTKAYYTTNTVNSGKGYLEIVSGNTSFTLEFIEPSPFVVKTFQRVAWFKNVLSNSNTILCYDVSQAVSNSSLIQSMPTSLNFNDRMNMASALADETRLSRKECEDIAAFLNDVLSGNYPASDEELYQHALSLETESIPAKLLEAIQIFQSLTDYKDSSERAKRLTPKYEDLLQHEKEQAILQKEADVAKRNKMFKILCVVGPIAAIILIMIVIGINKVSTQNKLEADYNNAVALFEEGSFEDAKEEFEELGDYEDSAFMVLECDYQYALEVMNNGIYDSALNHFLELKESTDNKEILEKCNVRITECKKMIAEKEQQLANENEYKRILGLKETSVAEALKELRAITPDENIEKEIASLEFLEPYIGDYVVTVGDHTAKFNIDFYMDNDGLYQVKLSEAYLQDKADLVRSDNYALMSRNTDGTYFFQAYFYGVRRYWTFGNEIITITDNALNDVYTAYKQ